MFIVLAVIITTAFFCGGCCSTKDTLSSTTTTRDTTITPPAVHDSVNTDYDRAIERWLMDQIKRLATENDSLRGVKPDTIKTKEYLPTKPFKHEWKAFKVTIKGDSIWVTFRYDNGSGTFVFKEVSGKITVPITSTNTASTSERQDPWYLRLWYSIKDGFLVLSLIANIIFIFVVFVFAKAKVPIL